jgi:glycosyltransferase involved in cell wall biosynthesis
MKRPRLLVVHPWMARGGSEATAMWALEALREDYELTFATAAPLRGSDWDALNAAYGTRVDPASIRVRRAPVLPGVDGPRRLAHLQVRWFERYCHRIAGDFDLCLSAYNPVHFGKPAIQLVGDFSFSEPMRRRLLAHADQPLRHRDTPLRRAYLALGRGIELPQPPLRERGDLVLANSRWAARQLAEFFGIEDAGVLHPPVPPLSAKPGLARDPHAFACLGRIAPEKEIERVVAILERVRGLGLPVTLSIAGHLDGSDYGRGVAALAERHRHWIATPGFLDLVGKRALLSSCGHGLHACRIEAFGIAVAEMAAAGCVPFVPREGGAGEIVPYDELQFGDDDEAVARIAALLRDPGLVRERSRELAANAAAFSPGRFVERLRGYVLEFLSSARRRSPSARPHEAAPQDLPTAH